MVAFRYPVAIGHLFNREVPAGGAPISGGWVPGGTTVYVTPLAAYSSTANFRNPESFVPERWLPESGAFSADEVRDVVQPFSMGPRDCLGRT